MPITFTFDLEDHRVGTSAPVRCAEPTENVLGWLRERDARGTVFVLGSLAEQCPDLVRAIANAGHEIALHGMHHVPIEETGEARYVDELRRGKGSLEDITGTQVQGYRAPIFSLGRNTPWAIPALAEAGFAYSSSVLPASNPLFGIAGVPRRPFRWRDGPIELPCPLLGHGRLAIPFLGGVYLRYLPMAAIRAGIRRTPDGVPLWSYLHPYDLDPEEPFEVLPHAGYMTSRLVHHHRRGTMDRMNRIAKLAGGLGSPLMELAKQAALDPGPEVAIDGAPDG
jgi:polysaccharide deacetylase family protein (PEP-CTERM system associated)